MDWAVRIQERATRGAPSIFDVILALAVTTVMIGGSVGESHPTVHATASQIAFIRAHQPGAAYILVVIAGLALIFRRRWPVPVLAVIVASVTVYAAAGYVPGAALCGVYVALYTVAVLEPRQVALVAGVVSMGVLFVASGAGGPFGWLGGTNTIMLACSVAAVALGLAVAGRRQVFSAMVERAERAERDREEQARRMVDAERLRIARELHDVVAHSMSMINVQAGVAAHVMSNQPEQAAEALAAIRVASREGLRELRAILNVLRQVDEEDDGRVPAPRLAQLEALADATTHAGLPTTVSVQGPREVLTPTVELATYRIVQESLTNVLRHAGPEAHATVEVVIGDRDLSVQVDDDGWGSTSAGRASGEFYEGTGAGLAGMRERAAAFGGTLDAGPRPGRGWRVRAVLPLPEGPVAQAKAGQASTDPASTGPANTDRANTDRANTDRANTDRANTDPASTAPGTWEQTR
jgi:signal transduction histidine kinase